MARPPMPAAAPPPTAADAMPPAGPDMGAAADAGNADEATEGGDECILTVCRDPAGGFVLYQGDEPEEPGEGTAAEEGAEGNEPAEGGGQHFDSPQELMRGIMQMLESDSGAEDAFAGGFKGDKGSAPAPGM